MNKTYIIAYTAFGENLWQAYEHEADALSWYAALSERDYVTFLSLSLTMMNTDEETHR